MPVPQTTLKYTNYDSIPTISLFLAETQQYTIKSRNSVEYSAEIQVKYKYVFNITESLLKSQRKQKKMFPQEIIAKLGAKHENMETLKHSKHNFLQDFPFLFVKSIFQFFGAKIKIPLRSFLCFLVILESLSRERD